MFVKYLTRTCAVLLAALMLSACENTMKDYREPFLGDYTFVSKGSVDMYDGATKLISIPMNEMGTLSILPGDDLNHVWVVAEGDSTLARVSDNELFMDPTTDVSKFGEVVMELSFTYGTATLEGDRLSFVTDVTVKATYQSQSLYGTGEVEIVATKK